MSSPSRRSTSRGRSRGRGSSSPGGRGGRGKDKKDRKEEGGYAEREIWSGRFRGWTRYDVKKPRLPNDGDKADWIESCRGRPTNLNGLIGNASDAACRTLQQYVNQFEGTKNLSDLSIISGPPGSGKTILSEIYVYSLGEDVLDLSGAQFAKWALFCDAKKYDASNYHELWKKIKEFIEVPVDSKTTRVPFKVVVLDDADTISATHQNSMKTLMDKNTMKLKWVFTSREPRKFIQYLQTKAVMVSCKAPSEKDALLIVLSFCYRFKIGFERAGVKCLFELCAKSNNNKGKLNLTDIMRLLQKCFVSRHFVSEDNAYVAAGKARPKVVVGPYAAVEPFPRCKICTLYPPCSHRSLEKLIQQSGTRRAELPERKGGLECREFMRTGACSIFNKHGHCSLDHPKRKVLVEKPRRRCPICTIVWPCNHCTYSTERNDLLAVRDEIVRRTELLEVLTQEDPPVYLITHLVDKFEGWEESLQGIKGFYATEERRLVLAEVDKWVATEYSTEPSEYDFKIAYLRRVFGELYVTPLLEERGRTASRGRSRGQSRQRVGGDDGGSVGSMSQSLDGSSVAGSMGSITVRTGTGTGSGSGSGRSRSKGPRPGGNSSTGTGTGGGGDDLASVGSMGTLAMAKSGS